MFDGEESGLDSRSEVVHGVVHPGVVRFNKVIGPKCQLTSLGNNIYERECHSITAAVPAWIASMSFRLYTRARTLEPGGARKF